MTISSIDKLARDKSISILREKFSKLAKNIVEGRRPVLVMPKRILSNTIYDEKNRMLLLGPEMQRRSFLDVNEARKFMQTLLMASIIYEALVNDEYPTIRDLYYRGKHTIAYRDPSGRLYRENTWDEQRESDSVIRDLEVFLGVLREEMLILSKEKGKVVGNLVIKSGDDTIDLSKMGHGAYSIEPTPDLIEFKEVDAEYVLVVEKDAVFQQLHRYGFWKKHKAILITSAGQPDRATRRFVRRLNEELKLPVYILADSIPADEIVIIRDRKTGKVSIGPIEELVSKYFSGEEIERIFLDIDVPTWDQRTNKIVWRRVGYVYRHRIKDKILKIKTQGRGVIRVTKAHSLFVFRNGKIEAIPAKDIKPGDYIVVATKLPPLTTSNKPVEINSLELIIKKYKPKYSKRFDLNHAIRVIDNTIDERIENSTGASTKYVMLSRSNKAVPIRIVLDEELAWLLGLFTAEGSTYAKRYIVFNLEPHELHRAEKIAEIIEKKFNIKPRIVCEPEKQIMIHVNSRLLYMILDVLGLSGTSRIKRIPDVITNSPPNILLAYIKGLLEGDGSIDNYGDIIYSTRSPTLAKQLFNLLLSLNIVPSHTLNGDEHIIRIGKSYERTPPEIYEYLTGKKTNSVAHEKISTEPTYSISINNKLKSVLVKLMNTDLISYSSKSKRVSKRKLERIKELEIVLPEDYNRFVESDIALVRVVEIEEEDYEGYVYDFAVPETNSFIGSYGIVYHNSDPYGFYIYSVFKIGSITLSYESERLATPNAKFIGVLMTDVFGDQVFENILKKTRITGFPKKVLRKLPRKKPYLSEQERRNYIIKAKLKDLERAVELVGYDIAQACLEDKNMKSKIRKKEGIVGYPWFRTPEWIRELCIFFNTLSKLEIEAMASKGLKFLAEKYIPEKIDTGDYID